MDRPSKLLLRLHLQRNSGLIRLTGPGINARIWIRNQALWGVQGVPRLFGPLCDRVPDPRALKGDLLADTPVLMAMGISLNEVTDAVRKRIGTLLAECTLDQDVHAIFENEAQPPPGSFGLISNLLHDFSRALPLVHPASKVVDELAGWSNTRVQVQDAAVENLGPLGPIAIRTLALAPRNRILGDLVRESGCGQQLRTQQAWLAVDLLWQLGLLEIPGAPPSTRQASFNNSSAASPEPSPEIPTPAEPSNEQQADDQEEKLETPQGGGWRARLNALKGVSTVSPTDRILDESTEDEQTQPLPQMEMGSLQEDDEYPDADELFGEPDDDDEYPDVDELFGEPDDDDDDDDDDENLATQPLTGLLSWDEEYSSDPGSPIQDNDDQPGTAGGPVMQGDPAPKDPTLPELRRRLQQLRSAPPLQALGMNHEELLTHLWLPSELSPTWQRARAPWLPENWRTASADLRGVAAEALEFLDETHAAMQYTNLYAQALQRSWAAIPKRESSTADDLVSRAQGLCARAEWEEALQVLDEARKANASSARAVLLQLFARVATRKMGVSHAVTWVYAISQNTNDRHLHAIGAYTAGRLLERSGKTADALACYQGANSALPQHKPSLARLKHLTKENPGPPSPLGSLFLKIEG